MKHTFYISGMHCPSCVLLTESELATVANVTSVKTSLATNTVELEGDFKDVSVNQLLDTINKVLGPHGYTVTEKAQLGPNPWSDFKLALPIATILILGFLLLQKTGLVNLITSSQLNYSSAFMIGVIASLSSCMAVVGGLVLSLSAHFAKQGQRVRPQLLFHIGRLASFFLFGGIIGALGASFQLSTTLTLALNLVVAVVLLIMGINLLDVFPWAKRIQLTMPPVLGRQLNKFKNSPSGLTPVVVGIATFFLPCGFTQSMQLYTITTGNFYSGAMMMTAFALGTLPALLVVSFGSLFIKQPKATGIFFKVAGILVLFFGILNLINVFVTAGNLTTLSSHPERNAVESKEPFHGLSTNLNLSNAVTHSTLRLM